LGARADVLATVAGVHRHQPHAIAPLDGGDAGEPLVLGRSARGRVTSTTTRYGLSGSTGRVNTRNAVESRNAKSNRAAVGDVDTSTESTIPSRTVSTDGTLGLAPPPRPGP